MDDPPHPIIDRPWAYEIIGLDFRKSLNAESESYLDLTLHKDGVFHRLRFYSPQGLELDMGFPDQTRGLYIADIRLRGLDRLGVRVDCREASHGDVQFWARSVEKLSMSGDPADPC